MLVLHPSRFFGQQSTNATLLMRAAHAQSIPRRTEEMMAKHLKHPLQCAALRMYDDKLPILQLQGLDQPPMEQA